ncbi:hypothetical protein [Halorubrum sp. Hd13]|uniref:hypothetical protein n=1 Tax=Halorubrum sp. Hd13 TaxID=1480728 RepID=UPI0011405508|nr:hypothetical protein [Halorubrum sp. Hd13]
MKRRNLMAGLGSLAAGGAAAMGTGAFSFLQTDRDISITVENDSDAYLGLIEDSPYAAENSNGELTFNFGASGNGGSGLNPNSVTLFDDVAIVRNQGTKEVELSVPDTTSDGFWSTNFVAYVQSNRGGGRQSIWPKDGSTSNFDDLLNDRTNISSLSDLITTGPDSITVSPGNGYYLGFAFATNEQAVSAGGSKSTGITFRAEET